MRALVLVITSSLLATGSIALAKSERGLVPAAVETGKPVSCIQLNRVQDSIVRSDSVIDFHISGKKYYRNTLPYSCPSLGFEEKFLHKSSMGQICSVDTITVLQSGGGGLDRGATCGLGKFQPVEISKQ